MTSPHKTDLHETEPHEPGGALAPAEADFNAHHGRDRA